jgi:hypothetical protein
VESRAQSTLGSVFRRRWSVLAEQKSCVDLCLLGVDSGYCSSLETELCPEKGFWRHRQPWVLGFVFVRAWNCWLLFRCPITGTHNVAPR